MRLLQANPEGSFSMTTFLPSKIPSRYAILSHTWELDDQEVTFKDLMNGEGNSKIGYRKIKFCAEQAARDGIQYLWVDSCCIDKSSSSELGEAINSMFSWYRNASKCYVYLSDVSTSKRSRSSESPWLSAFRTSRWFTRGWTLQELLAPDSESLQFYSREGKYLGNKQSLGSLVSGITGIPASALRGGFEAIEQYKVDERMSWAAKRVTTIQEDQAYCLLGLFNVHIPLIYGEGRDNAFRRLREEIYKLSSRDEKPKDQERLQTIGNWLSTTNFPAQQLDFLARRETGTGQWFLNSPQVSEWLRGRKKTLFCPGMPGAGKTMIAAIMIDHLSKKQNNNTGLAYLYCNYKAQAELDTYELLAAILKQLLLCKSKIPDSISRLYEKHTGQNTRPSLQDISNLCFDVTMTFSTTYLVIDALDECSTQNGARYKLLNILHKLQHRADLRIMATSRIIPEIVQQFENGLVLEVRANDADIKQFIRGQLHRLPKCIQHDLELQRFVEDEIAAVADGMFLLARLWIDSLLDKRSKAMVKSTLKSLGRSSNSLHEAYDGAIKRMNAQLPEDRALARRALSWITYAQRPLTTIELLHALAVSIGDTCLDRDKLLDIDDVILVCVGLVAVDERSDIIRLVHYTAQEYFQQMQEALSPDALNDIASTCLTYLLFKPFRAGHCLRDFELEYRLGKNPFLDYAAHFWSQHAQMVQDQQVQDLATSFLENSCAVASAVQVVSVPESRYKFKNYSQRKVPRGLEGLHVTAMLGLLNLSRILLSRPECSINTKDTQGRTPLSWASGNGHQAVVHLLIEAGADLNAQKLEGMTALHEASKNGHEAVVRRLLDANAQVDMKDRDGTTALHMATENGHEAVVKMLLDARAQVNIRDQKDYTALSIAVHQRHTAIVELLLDARADVYSMSYISDPPLYIATSEGYEDIVRLLLDAGADVEGTACTGDTPLQDAVYQGREDIVDMLLEAGAHIDARGYNGDTPLTIAAKNRDEDMVQLLLAAGAELDDEDLLDGLEINLDDGSHSQIDWDEYYYYEAMYDEQREAYLLEGGFSEPKPI